MTRRDIRDRYFIWLSDLVYRDRYNRLLTRLHEIEFRYLISKDQNRAEDGEALRYRFALDCFSSLPSHSIIDVLDQPCSVLEMMIALAIRCEEDIMDDPNIGNRTSQWFWAMIVNLGLGRMYDDGFDEKTVDDVIECFLDRDYEPNGKGGLFTVRHCDRDLRYVEIWHQLCWYLDEIT